MIFNNPDQLNQALRAGRLMALDLGTKRIGVAISDESRLIANPRLIINRLSNEKDFAKILQFIKENNIVGIIIGQPTQMDGTPHEMFRFSKKFTENFDEFLKGEFPILLFEERLTSSEARILIDSPLSNRKNKYYDDIAASVILQHLLDDLASIQNNS
jgi:putative Holliday junction resolvase